MTSRRPSCSATTTSSLAAASANILNVFITMSTAAAAGHALAPSRRASVHSMPSLSADRAQPWPCGQALTALCSHSDRLRDYSSYHCQSLSRTTERSSGRVAWWTCLDVMVHVSSSAACGCAAAGALLFIGSFHSSLLWWLIVHLHDIVQSLHVNQCDRSAQLSCRRSSVVCVLLSTACSPSTSSSGSVLLFATLSVSGRLMYR